MRDVMDRNRGVRFVWWGGEEIPSKAVRETDSPSFRFLNTLTSQLGESGRRCASRIAIPHCRFDAREKTLVGRRGEFGFQPAASARGDDENVPQLNSSPATAMDGSSTWELTGQGCKEDFTATGGSHVPARAEI